MLFVAIACVLFQEIPKQIPICVIYYLYAGQERGRLRQRRGQTFLDFSLFLNFYVFLINQFRDMITLDQALTEIMQLDYNSREMLLEILQKRQIEARRTEIAENAQQAKKDYEAGNIKPMSAEEAIIHLHTL